MKAIIISIIYSLITLSLCAQNAGDLKIDTNGLRNKEGNLSITLFNEAEGFPEDFEKAFRSKTIDLSKNKSVIYFHNLPVGEYAYAILHDEDRNGEMKKNVFGMPREGFGFSNNYQPKIKNPSFKDASFYLSPGTNEHVIEIIYFMQ